MVDLPFSGFLGAKVTVFNPTIFNASDSAGITKYLLSALKGIEYRKGVSVLPSEKALSDSETGETLTDSSKLNKIAFYQVCPIHKITALITDHHEDLNEYKKTIPNVIAIDPKDYE